MTDFFGNTDIGLKRETNEDSFYTGYIDEKRLLCVVCDGMGGANGGSDASGTAVEIFTDYVRNNAAGADIAEVLDKAVKSANDGILKKAAEHPELFGMGTTLVAALFDGDKIYFASIGDSRIYVYADKALYQLSHDHSYVQSLVDSGQITAEQAKSHPNRNIITKALGTADDAKADLFVLDAQPIGGVLLCSDGLCGYADESDI